MIVIPKNYNKETGYYDALAIVSDGNKGTEHDPFTEKDISKAIKMAKEDGYVGNYLTHVFVGERMDQIPDDLPVITDMCIETEPNENGGLNFISN